ncbi:hypothetical protein [Streptomyces sp. NBC_01538]|uniref:hypothetical protein n=1 Tax=Streptomyces sp. NBC_01538 TaxID=2903897 RepID=UPI0038681BDE
MEAIGQGTATGFMGDRLLGPAPEVQEEHEVQEELSQRYLRAISATDPFAAFMGYYQVLEYSMEEEWFQALRRRVEAAGGMLERPTDSIRKAAKPAAYVLGERTDDLGFREIRGLKAVLDRHLDIGALATDLDRYLQGAAAHFATGTVPFAQVPHLDFGRAGDPAGQAALRERAAERIYKIRCAITHSKESGDRYSRTPTNCHWDVRCRSSESLRNICCSPPTSGCDSASNGQRRCLFQGPVIASMIPGV